MQHKLTLLLISTALVLQASSTFAQQPDHDGALASEIATAEPTERAKPSAVGEKAPNFRLRDQNGDEHSLDELLKKGPVAIVFYRSAEW